MLKKKYEEVNIAVYQMYLDKILYAAIKHYHYYITTIPLLLYYCTIFHLALQAL